MKAVFLLNGQYFATVDVTESEEIRLHVPAADHGEPHVVRFQAIALHLSLTERVIYVAELPEDEFVELEFPVYVEEGN